MVHYLKQFLASPVFEQDEDKTNKARVLNSLLVSILIVLGVFVVIDVPFFAVRKLGVLVTIALAVALLLFVRFLMNRGQVRRASICFLGGAWVIFTTVVFFSGGIASITPIFFLVTTVLAGLLLGQEVAIGVAVASSVTSLGMIVMEIMGYPPPRYFPMPVIPTWITLTLSLAITIIPLNLTLRARSQALALAHQELAERKATEASLRASEERYRIITELISDYAYAHRVEPDGSFTFEWITSDSARRMTGYDPLQEIGSSFILYHPDDQAKANQHVQETIQGKPTSDDYRIITKAGELRWVHIDRHPVWDPAQQRVVRFYGVSKDITERKRVEEALRESEERNRVVSEMTTDYVFIVDVDENGQPKLRWISDIYTNQTISTLDEILCPDQWLKFIHQEDVARFSSFLAQTIVSGEQGEIECRSIARKERERWIQIFCKPQQQADGKVVSILGAVKDITERKRSEEVLQRYQLLSQNARDIILFIRLADGQILEANQAAVQAYGYDRQELVTKNIRDLRAPETESILKEQLNRANVAGIFFETLHCRKDGSVFPVEVSSAGMTLGGERVLLSIIRDISQRKQAEVEREQLIKELEAKNAELERFTYTVSHDLKSPLITIQGFLGYLERDALAGKVDRMKADISRINEAANKMQRLLNELLELSRIGRLMNPSEEVPFETIVREALELVQGRLAERGIEIKLAENLPVVYGDRIRLVEVVQNLLENAAKFMGDQARPRINIGVREQGGEAIFFVQDNGIGIAPQYHQKVFGLFDKLDPQSDGTGVGLALVKRIVEVHGGRIWVESEGPGQGSTFWFSLPTVAHN